MSKMKNTVYGIKDRLNIAGQKKISELEDIKKKKLFKIKQRKKNFKK